MKELLEYLARSLVDSPDAVEVNVVEDEQLLLLQLRVAQDDMGKVIGKQGRIAKALRTIVKAASVREGKKVMVEILD